MIVWIVAEMYGEGDLHAFSSAAEASVCEASSDGTTMGSFNVSGQPTEVWVVAGACSGCFNCVTHVFLTEAEAKSQCDAANRRDKDGLEYFVIELAVEGKP